MSDKKERIGVNKPHARKRAETPFNRGTIGPNAYHIPAATDGLPAASWWVSLGRGTRGEFDAGVRREARRMQHSKFGRAVPASVIED